jgi:hypothetical protein
VLGTTCTGFDVLTDDHCVNKHAPIDFITRVTHRRFEKCMYELQRVVFINMNDEINA